VAGLLDSLTCILFVSSTIRCFLDGLFILWAFIEKQSLFPPSYGHRKVACPRGLALRVDTLALFRFKCYLYKRPFKFIMSPRFGEPSLSTVCMSFFLFRSSSLNYLRVCFWTQDGGTKAIPSALYAHCPPIRCFRCQESDSSLTAFMAILACDVQKVNALLEDFFSDLRVQVMFFYLTIYISLPLVPCVAGPSFHPFFSSRHSF